MLLFPFYPNYNNHFIYPHYSTTYRRKINSVQENIKEKKSDTTKNNIKRSSKNNYVFNVDISSLLDMNLNSPIIEILDIKLYLDDLIIICILFFLYKEGVKDEILFITLLLLLLS